MFLISSVANLSKSLKFHISPKGFKTVTYPLLLHFVKSNLCWCPLVHICFLGFHLLVILTGHNLLQAALALFILLLFPKDKDKCNGELISSLRGKALPSWQVTVCVWSIVCISAPELYWYWACTKWARLAQIQSQVQIKKAKKKHNRTCFVFVVKK